MFYCSYCSNEFQWYGSDYQISANGSFCSPVCGNKSGIENDKLYRFCVFAYCGKEFHSTDKITAPDAFLCYVCKLKKLNK